MAEPLFTCTVRPEWIDYNGHMNDAYYALVFSRALDRLMTRIGLAQDGRTPDSPTIYTLTATIHYLAEVKEGETVSVETRILAYDPKRLHLWAQMNCADGVLSALSEQVFLCVDQSSGTPRSRAFPDAVHAAIARVHGERAHEPMPDRAGAGISLARRKTG